VRLFVPIVTDIELGNDLTYLRLMKNICLLDITIFYINLDCDIEKNAKIKSTLEKRGFSDVRRIAGTIHENKKTGVALAHKEALLAGLKTNKPFIVLEDDIVEYSFRERIDVPEDADAYYLGVSIWGLVSGNGKRVISLEPHEEDVYRIYNMLSAHAILYLNLDYVRFLFKSIDFFIKIETNQDKGRAESMKYWNIYAGKKPLFAQSDKFYKSTAFDLPGLRWVTPKENFLNQSQL
jgi:hypothetical protein